MNILVLGYIPSPVTPIIKAHNDQVIEVDHPIDIEFLKKNNIIWAIVFGYRHIIKKPVIDYLEGKIINLHISLLPWNRGADPNLWSFLENTPKGVTIHYIDEGLDTGDIIAQKELFFNNKDHTLATTYSILKQEIIDLFKAEWPNIRQSKAKRLPQGPGGSFHFIKDKKKYEHLLAEKGWDTPINSLIGKAYESKNS